MEIPMRTIGGLDARTLWQMQYQDSTASLLSSGCNNYELLHVDYFVYVACKVQLTLYILQVHSYLSKRNTL